MPPSKQNCHFTPTKLPCYLGHLCSAPTNLVDLQNFQRRTFKDRQRLMHYTRPRLDILSDGWSLQIPIFRSYNLRQDKALNSPTNSKAKATRIEWQLRVGTHSRMIMVRVGNIVVSVTYILFLDATRHLSAKHFYWIGVCSAFCRLFTNTGRLRLS